MVEIIKAETDEQMEQVFEIRREVLFASRAPEEIDG